jgi:hypothetical protein
LKHFTFQGISNYHTLDRIGEYLIVASDKELFYASIDSDLRMSKYDLPTEVKNLNSVAPVSGSDELFLLDNSKYVRVLSFRSESFLKIVKIYKLKSGKHMHLHRVMTLQNIPQTTLYLASADINQIAKIDHPKGSITYFK